MASKKVLALYGGQIDELHSGDTIDGALTNPMTAAEDIIVGDVGGAPKRLAAGSEGQVAKIVSGAVAWADEAGGVANNGICEGRLTLESGVPVSTTDQTAKTSIYFTPYKGNQIALYDGVSAWSVSTFTERTLSLTGLTASKNHDVFIYDDSGTLTLQAVEWTNDTTRATALTKQDGVYVKSGATTHRYLGSFRTTSTTGQTEIVFNSASQAPQILLWNYYNRVKGRMVRRDTTNSWTYNSTTIRQANNSAANQCNFIVGVAEDHVRGEVKVSAKGGTATFISAMIGLDVANAVDTNSIYGIVGGTANTIATLSASHASIPAAGYHYLSWNEQTAGATLLTFYCYDATYGYQGGLITELNY